MANAISSIKMANPIKSIVSKQRIRYVEDGFNLDLAYINDNIIAMGFPGEKIEGFYRNHIGDVIKFLESKHNGKYKIYNLCSERSYDKSKFQEVATYPFADHNPPRIEQIKAFCEDVEAWLKGYQHVAAVHCKAGKGRTGTMICCFLLYIGKFKTANEALVYYGEKRARDNKGVTIPSQRRYVEYFERLINNPRDEYKPMPVKLVKLKLTPPFHSFHPGSYHVCIHDYMLNPETNRHKLRKFCNLVPDLKKTLQNGPDSACIMIDLKLDVEISGDIKIEFYSKNVVKKQKLFQFWFNTFFASKSMSRDDDGNLQYTLKKFDIDDAHKDKTHRVFPSSFQVDVIFQIVSRENDSHHTQQQLENSNHTNHNHTNGAENWMTSENGAVLTAAHVGQQLSTTTAAINQQHVSVTSPAYKNVAPENAEALPSCDSSPTNSNSSIESEWDSVDSPEITSLVRYRLLSEPEIGNLMKVATKTNGVPSATTPIGLQQQQQQQQQSADNNNSRNNNNNNVASLIEA